MKQGQQVVAPLGFGAMKICECSNDSSTPIPSLTLMRPADCEYLEGFAVHHPAESFILLSKQVRQLYDFLKVYYDPTSNDDKKAG
jgi:hypothetical protein